MRVGTGGPTIPQREAGSTTSCDNDHQYLIQEMWSNQDNACLQGTSYSTASITHRQCGC